MDILARDFAEGAKYLNLEDTYKIFILLVALYLFRATESSSVASCLHQSKLTQDGTVPPRPGTPDASDP